MEENLLEQVKTKFPEIHDADLEPEKIAIPGEDQTNQSDSGSSRSSRAEAPSVKSTEPTPSSSKSSPGTGGSQNLKKSLDKKSETSNQKTEVSETISSSEVKSEKSDKPTTSENKKAAIRIRTVHDINENSDRDHENMSPVSITHEEDKGAEPQEKDEDELDESVVEITPDGTEKVTPCGEKSKSERKFSKIKKSSIIEDKSSRNVEPKILDEKSRKESELSPGTSRVRIKTVDDINENSDRDFGNISPISITHEVGEEEESSEEKNSTDDEVETEKDNPQGENKKKKNKKENKGEKDNENEIKPKNKEKEKRGSKDKKKEDNLKEKKTENKVPEDENCEEGEAGVEITPMQDVEFVPKTSDKPNKQDEKYSLDLEKTTKDTSTEHAVVSKDIETPKDKGDSTLGLKTRKSSKDGSNAENSEPVIENADSTPDDIIVEITEEICVKKPKILEGVTTTPASDEHLSDCNLNPEPENQDLENSDIFAESDTAEPDENHNLSGNDTSKLVPDKSNVPNNSKKSVLEKAEIPTPVGKINADKMKKSQARLGGVVETSDEDDNKQKDQKSARNSKHKSAKNADQESTKNSDQESTKGSDKEETATKVKTRNKTTDKTDISKDNKKMSSSKRSKVTDKDKKCSDKTISLCQFTSSDDDSALRPGKSTNGEEKIEKAGSVAKTSSDDEKEKYERLNKEAKAAVLNSSSSEDENTSKVETSTPRKPESKSLEDMNRLEAEKRSDTDIERLNEEAKAVVLQSTSSDNEPLKKIMDHEEGSPRKKLKTKRELDKIRRKSGQTDNLEEDTSDEEDLDGQRSRKRKIEDVSSEQKKKQKVVSNSEDEVEDEKSKLDYDLSDIDIENLRPCRVEICRLNPGVRRELRKYRKVSENELWGGGI